MLPPQISERGRYQYTTQQLTKYMKFQPYRDTSLTGWFYRFSALISSTIISHQMIYFASPRPINYRLHMLQGIKSTIRPMEHTLTVFTIKIMADLLEEKMRTKWSEYTKGGISGLLGYVISRPLDQMELAKKQIKNNENKVISRVEALRVVIRHDGLRGLYKNENILAPMSAIIYRSILFGMWHRLNSKYDNKILHLFVFPFVASFCASIATMMPDKCRAYCFLINEERSKSIERKYRKEKVELRPVFQMLLDYISSKQFRFGKQQLMAISVSILKNWLILSLFALGQFWAQREEAKDRKSIQQ